MAEVKLNEKQKRHISKMGLIIIAQVVIMVTLTIIMVLVVSDRIDKMIVADNTAITKEKCAELELYMQNSSTILSDYTSAGEILDVLEHPDDPEAVAAAQAYTERISAGLKNLEGIYVSKWNTEVLAHTNPKVVGIITRRDPESLNDLHEKIINSPENMYSAGIILSPASSQQIISLYKGVFDSSGKPIGLVGLGILTDGIVEDMEARNTKITSDSQYYMIDTHNQKYVFAHNKDLMNKTLDDPAVNTPPEFISLSNELAATMENKSGTFTFRRDGKLFYGIYSYVGYMGQVFIIDGSTGELFRLTYDMLIYLIIFTIIYIAVAFFFYRLVKKQEETVSRLDKSMKKTAKTKESLNAAIFQDILTDCRNRVSFSNDFERGNIQDSPDHPYYFMMFNIAMFSSINILYGEDIGDEVLTNVANTIRTNLEGAELYRTGSDEFVAVMQEQGSLAGRTRICSYADQTIASLSNPINTSAGPVNAVFRASIVKKSTGIDLSVLPALKDTLNQSGQATPGQIPFLDMDTL
ncbi:diguanylate cyclase [Ruminococcus sp. HUN007]|uniref:diguanylate cyclase domain-containing protein n=1 Tax=Ruminococcus sp. HUN007 TaxID=1514668 RepID=UPI0005D28158|nr:diguanylate cyclase [Ruminococcus sp. HUN007]